MVLTPTFPWYFDTPSYGILIPFTWYIDTLTPYLVKIPWVGVDISWVRGQYTIGRRVKIPWIGRSKYHGNGVDIPWVGGQYIMDRRVIIWGKCVNIPPWYFDLPIHGILTLLPMVY
jgi:hypothetical protein